MFLYNLPDVLYNKVRPVFIYIMYNKLRQNILTYSW